MKYVCTKKLHTENKNIPCTNMQKEFSQKENNRIYNAEDMKETITVTAYKPLIFVQLRESEVDR